MKKHFIVNPAAGRGKHMYSVIEKLRAQTDGKNKFSVYATKDIGDAEKYAREVASDGEEHCFYVCGGDGTLGEVLNGICDFPNSVMALIPAGTGNDFVRNFYSNADEKHAFVDIPAQFEGREIPSDYLDVVIDGERKRKALNVLNAGLDCEVARRVNELRGNKFVPTKLSYYYGLAEQFIKKPGLNIRVFADGKEIANGEKTLISIGNGAYYGGGFKSLTNASINDGLLDLCMIENVTRTQFLGLVGAYKEGKHLEAKGAENIVTYGKYKSVRIEFDDAQNVSFDGEIERCKTLDISISEKPVRIILPKGIDVSLYRPQFERVEADAVNEEEYRDEVLL